MKSIYFDVKLLKIEIRIYHIQYICIKDIFLKYNNAKIFEMNDRVFIDPYDVEMSSGSS